MALSARDKRAVTLGAAAIGLGLLVRLVVMPVATHWGQLRSTVSSYGERINFIEQKLDRRDAIVGRQQLRFGPGVDLPLEPVEKVRLSFPQTVQKALGEGGLGVSSVEPQGVRKLRDVAGVVMVALRVRCGGGPDSLPQALAAIQKSERLIIVDSFDLSMASPDDRGSWSVTMQVSTPALEAANK